MAGPFDDKWAILIGPTEYKKVKPLRYCANDVTQVGATLRSALEFRDDHILEFGTGLKHKPEFTEVQDELGGLLKSGRIKENDLLLFYFSGHGINDRKDYLLPVDASPNNLKRTGIQVEDLVDQLVETRCKNVVMFIDACREAIDGARGAGAIGEDSKGIAERSGVITFFSCAPQDLSYEIDELKHGSFTHCFLEAMKSRRCVTAADVYDYLLREVPLTNQKYKKPPQQPYAVIKPDEKRLLQLLYSGTQAVSSAAQWGSLIDQLADIYNGDWPIAAKYFNAGIELLSIAQERELTGDDSRKLVLIERLCAGELTSRAFAAAWDALDRRGSQSGKATIGVPSLGPLT